MPTGVASWSKTASANASADTNVNAAEGMAPAQVNDAMRAMMASTAMWRDDLSGVTTAGTLTAFTVTTNQGFASLAALNTRRITIIPHVSSGAAPTLSVDGLVAKPMRLQTGVNAPPAAFVQGSPYGLQYNDGNGEFLVYEGTSGSLVGAVMPFAGATAPGGWHLCCGQAVSRTVYAALFAVIGTTFGIGDGSTTFNLPDVRGRTIAGLDGVGGFGTINRITVAGGNFDGTVLGGSGGAQSHTAAELPLHHHGIFPHDPGHWHWLSNGTTAGAPGSAEESTQATANAYQSGTSATNITLQSAADIGGVAQGTANQTSDVGSGTAMSVLPPTLVLNYIIKF